MVRAALFLIALATSACGVRSTERGPVQAPSTLMPPMPAHVKTFQKWEHHCVKRFIDSWDTADRVAQAGSEGWEMVGLTDTILCFKRPAPPPPPEPAPPAPTAPSDPAEPAAPATSSVS